MTSQSCGAALTRCHKDGEAAIVAADYLPSGAAKLLKLTAVWGAVFHDRCKRQNLRFLKHSEECAGDFVFSEVPLKYRTLPEVLMDKAPHFAEASCSTSSNLGDEGEYQKLFCTAPKTMRFNAT